MLGRITHESYRCGRRKNTELDWSGTINMEIEKLKVRDLHLLTELFDYNNVEQMISECTQEIGWVDDLTLNEKTE